jgi:hypothetical protein
VNYSALGVYSAQAIKELSLTKADISSLSGITLGMTTLSGGLQNLSNSLFALQDRLTRIAENTGSTVVNNYYSSNNNILPTVSNTGIIFSGSLDIRDRDTLEAITDTLDYITSKITALISIVREVIALRIVALEGYFDRLTSKSAEIEQIHSREITTEKLCMKKSNGTIVCFTAEELE